MNKNKIGVLWLRKNEKGEFYSGVIEDDKGLKSDIIIFKNGYKDKNTHPDYIIYKKREKQENTENEVFGTDLPF